MFKGCRTQNKCRKNGKKIRKIDILATLQDYAYLMNRLLHTVKVSIKSSKDTQNKCQSVTGHRTLCS